MGSEEGARECGGGGEGTGVRGGAEKINPCV